MGRDTDREGLDKRRVLREAFAEQLPFRVRQVEALVGDVLRDVGFEDAWRALRLALRSLAGSSQALKLVGFADAARRFELAVQSEGASGAKASAALEARLAKHLQALKTACLAARHGELAEVVDSRGSDGLGPERASRVLFFLSANDDISRDLSFELGCFGFGLRRFRDPVKLRQALEQASPAAVMIDAEPFTWGLEQARLIDEVRQREEISTSLLILSSRSDMESRLAAVRAGGNGYYVHPIESSKLLERLARVARHSGAAPYRILIVSGDYGASLDHALTVQRAGMSMVIAERPLEVWRQLVEFRPEAILMDLELEEVGGELLGAVIRQQDAYVNVPIVFVARKATLDTQLAALRAEGDELLIAPVDESYLVSTLSHHVQRARAIEEFVGTDSLTGLLTHSAFVARIEIEIERALRTASDLAYAILDIDHLNSINETYGHLSGDSVLTNLARLLVRRLRRADLLGRWGGDELVVLMPETNGADALRVLEHVREMFAGIPHRSGDHEFVPTFSGGVVSVDPAATAESLHQAARSALMSARIQGRSRIVLAGP